MDAQGWPVWFNPTGKLLQQKLVKKLMLAMIDPIHGGPISQFTGFKRSAADVPDTAGHLQRSCGVHASAGQGGVTRETNTILGM